MNRSVWLALFIATVLPPGLAADSRFERVAGAVTAEMKARGIPGVALGVCDHDACTSRGFGVTSTENPLPVTPDTLFQIGSITKTMTAAAVMRLVRDGKVKLDAPVRDYLPDFQVRDENASRGATVRTLLTHMGGWEGDLFEDTGAGDDALARIVRDMATLEQVAPLNAFWSYNNAGFYAAGRLIEVVTGQTYERAVKHLVFEEPGMHRTFFSAGEVMTYRFAAGHAGPVVLRPWSIPRGMNPAGGAVATIDDLLKYGQWQMRGETTIGWQVSNIGKDREIWQDGFAVGQTALLFLVPSRGLVAAITTSSVEGEAFDGAIRRAIAREYLGVTIADPAPIPPPADVAQYAGRYSRPFMDIVVTASGGGLLIQRLQRQGFPTRDSPIPPAAPPSPYAFYAKDQLIDAGGDRVEFVRDAAGRVSWIRVGGRLARRM